MPAGKQTKKIYLALDKDKGGLKQKIGEDQEISYRTWCGEIVDFHFRDNEYKNKVSTQLLVSFREYDTNGEEMVVQVQTASQVWIDSFLNLIANAPGPGDAKSQEFVEIGAFKPDDKDFLYCFMNYGHIDNPNKARVTKMIEPKFADPSAPTEAEKQKLRNAIFDAAAAWRLKHLGLADPRIPHYDADGKLKATYGDTSGAPTQADGVAHQEPEDYDADPLSDDALKRDEPMSFDRFVSEVKTWSTLPEQPEAFNAVHSAEKQKARDFYAHYYKIWAALETSTTPGAEVELLKKQYKGNWEKVVDHIYDVLVAAGKITDGGLDDDLPF